jgi:hypothetical protein
VPQGLFDRRENTLIGNPTGNEYIFDQLLTQDTKLLFGVASKGARLSPEAIGNGKDKDYQLQKETMEKKRTLGPSMSEQG